MTTPEIPQEAAGNGPSGKKSNTWIMVLIVLAVLATPAICVCAGAVGVLVLRVVPSSDFQGPEPRKAPSDWGPPERLRELPAEREEPQPVTDGPGAGPVSGQEAAMADAYNGHFSDVAESLDTGTVVQMVLSSLLGQSPILLAMLIGAVVAVVRWRRHPGISVLVFSAVLIAALTLLTSMVISACHTARTRRDRSRNDSRVF